MKKILQSIIIGIGAAIGGLFVSELTRHIFNGMDFGSAAVLGFGMYLCVVVVTCTGIIISKLDKHAGEPRGNISEQDRDDNLS